MHFLFENNLSNVSLEKNDALAPLSTTSKTFLLSNCMEYLKNSGRIELKGLFTVRETGVEEFSPRVFVTTTFELALRHTFAKWSVLLQFLHFLSATGQFLLLAKCSLEPQRKQEWIILAVDFDFC